jgi:hypothetical protein
MQPRGFSADESFRPNENTCNIPQMSDTNALLCRWPGTASLTSSGVAGQPSCLLAPGRAPCRQQWHRRRSRSSPRTELTKKLWAYIRKNGLQDAKKRTLINADENLKAVFNGKKQVSMFEMTKLVSGHVKK